MPNWTWRNSNRMFRSGIWTRTKRNTPRYCTRNHRRRSNRRPRSKIRSREREKNFAKQSQIFLFFFFFSFSSTLSSFFVINTHTRLLLRYFDPFQCTIIALYRIYIYIFRFSTFFNLFLIWNMWVYGANRSIRKIAVKNDCST